MRINSSDQCTNSKYRDINVRSVLGKSEKYYEQSVCSLCTYFLVLEAGNLSGVGHAGLVKICGALNLPPPIEEDHFSSLMRQILPTVQQHQQESMKRAAEEA